MFTGFAGFLKSLGSKILGDFLLEIFLDSKWYKIPLWVLSVVGLGCFQTKKCDVVTERRGVGVLHCQKPRLRCLGNDFFISLSNMI